MNRLQARLKAATDSGQRGFTMVEMLVASSLFMLLNVFTFTAVFGHARVTEAARDATDINQEARLVLNRMARELREASAVTGATNPGAFAYSPAYATFNANADSSLTFGVDFNNNNVIEPNAPDPEVITYKYDRAGERLLLQAGGQTLPVLAANVTAFKLSFTSRLHEYNGTLTGGVPNDRIVTWEELDADPALVRGNQNKLLDMELAHVDSVVIDITLFQGQRKQTYRTQVDLRNRPY